ncbi:MAG TPA: GEVED domain-containing protein [Propionicimonas sp.]|uniref:DUF7507 domain-containing protein n=1 Tax=Propionicimonas sp. TaxID=1955623 RepID=UPI002F408121
MIQHAELRSRAPRRLPAHAVATRFCRVLTAMVLAVGFLSVGLPATPAAAVQATGGTARFPSIEWFSWGADGATIPNAGITRTENYTLAGQPFNITCTLSNINRTAGTGTGSYLESYRSGTWQGDGFDSLYNIGGIDGANTMVVGLSNHTQGNTITVDFSCSATLAGNDFPLAGLVMADAEASGGTEYVGATIPTSATWRILDRVRGANCTQDTYARRTVAGTANRLELYGPANNTCEGGADDVRPGPSSVAFMDGSSSATNVTISGSGKSAIALGVAFNTDFGDAPASYGNAGAALQFAYTGGDVPVTPSTDTLAANRGTPVFGNITLATNVQPTLRLGASVDPEATQQYSANATGDDTDGEAASGGPDDENGIAINNPVEVAPGTNLTLGPVACTGSGFIAGWIDWNLNGVFDASEKSTNTAQCSGNSANLTIPVPGTILPTGGTLNTFLRIRFARTQAQLTPTGITTGGEVEDYRFVAGAKARVILRKTTLGGTGGPWGFTLTNTTQTTGTATTTTAGTAVQVDGNTAVTGTDAYVAVATGSAVTINESSILAGWAISSVTCNDGTSNVGTLSGTTVTIPGSATGPGSIVTCDFRNGQPAVGLTKSAGTLSGNTAGSTIPYTFTVTNTGQTPLSAIAITDPKVTGLTCVATSLAIGASTTCTATHTLTQAEVDAGTVVNNASVTATPPSGPVVTNTATATATIPRAPGISLAKTAGTPSGNIAGSTVAYSFLVTNTGNLTLTGVSVTDPTVGTVTCPATTLAPGAALTCTKTYTLTQADVNAGAVNNTATAAGTPPTGAAVTATSTANRTITRTATMTLDKQAGTPTGSTAGSTIAYTFIVTNTGNVTLTGVGVTDARVGAITCPQTTLAPGTATTCTKTYVITQADVDAGVVNNTASVTGTPPAGVTAPTATDNTTSTLTRTTTITLDKQFSGLTDSDSNGQDAGDRLNYTFLVTNTGNVTLTAVGVTDAKATNLTCPASTLAPGASTTCTGSYLLTQADVDAGHVANTATATGTPPTGLTRPTATDSTDTPVTPGPSISLDKTGAAPSGNTAGSTIAYTFVVTNTGNVTLTAVGVKDPTIGTVTCPVTTLAPGASTTCTKSYTLTQADINAGTVVNTATASGTSPAAVTVSATDSVTSNVTRTATLTMDKQAGALSGSTAGSTQPYSFIVTNTGNVTVTAMSVTDPKAAGLTCPATALAPGASTTCTATHALTQAEVDAGHVANTASVTATPPSGMTAPTASDSTDTTIAQTAAISLDKQAGVPSGATPGSTIAYSFIVTNTGNVTLTAVAISDAQVTAVSCPVTTLTPGASTTCAASYPITQADLDAGVVTNTATATGTPPGTMTRPTAGDSTTTPLAAAPALTVDKQAGTPSSNLAGGSIAYTFIVRNTGNVTLHAVGVSDPKAGTVSCPVSVLAPGVSTTCTKTYILTQPDVDAGTVDNTATATGTPPTGTAVTSTDSVTSPITRAPSITLDKTAAAPSGNTAGSTIAYSFLVTNSGNVTLTTVGVTDPRVGAVTCPLTTLAPGASTTCTKSYPLTQADVDAGSVINTATARGTSPTAVVVSSTDAVTSTITRTASLTMDKQAGLPSGFTVGSTIAYTFIVTNAGNVTLTTVGVTDDKVGAVTCPQTTLAPGASTTCAKTYTLTQADVDSGHVANTATATGTPPTGTAVTATDSTDTGILAAPAITLDKQAAAPSGNTAGSTVAYSFVVRNTGNVTLHGVAVTDPRISSVDCPATTLAPGATTTCTATYTLTQADVDLGVVNNTASVAGTPPTGAAVTATDTAGTPVPAAASISLDKQAATPSGATAGSTIAYAFVVRNDGNVTLHGLAVTDANVGPVTCTVTTLAPGAATTCSKTYTLTQADVDSGHVANTASVAGTPPTGTPVTATDSTDSPIAAGPTLALDKTAAAPTGNTAGSTIAYSFLVTNTGNVTLTSVGVTDVKVSGITCPATTLAPGGSTTCTKAYTLTQADVDAGSVVNTATAAGTPPTGAAVTAIDTVTSTITRTATLAMDKQAGTPSGSTAGSTIPYAFVVTNTGNTTLTGLVVTDPTIGATACSITTLSPGQVATCTGSYTLTQADVDAGHLANSASVSATPPSGLATPTATDSTDSPITAAPAIALDKTAGAPSGNTAGSTVPYTFVVTNTGTVTLHAVAVDDATVGTVSCPETSLAPGATTTCTATYTLTQADVDAGSVVNTATASGTPPTGAPVTETDSVSTPVPAAPAITLDKQVGTPSGSSAGSTLAYSFVVKNTGNVTLGSIAVGDAKVGSVTCPTTTLAPGATTTCARTYTLTQADVDAGHVANTALVAGTPPTGAPVTATDDTDSPIVNTPAITVDKQAAAPTGNTPGSTIAYTFIVKNTGNVTLTSVAIGDARVPAVSCPAATLAPAATMTCTASYTLTQADVDAGSVVNTALVAGTPPTGAPVTATDTVTTTVIAAPAVTLDKQAAAPSGTSAGATIAYSFIVQNTGNVTLHGVEITDPAVGPVTCATTTLAPNATTTCTRTYPLSQADVDSGHVANTASVAGTPPTGAAVVASDSTDSPITPGPAITLDKTAAAPSGTIAGSTVAYTFVVTNTGNVTLSSLDVSDPQVGPVICPSDILAPGASTTCTKTYTLTQADVDAGSVVNTATVAGTPPTGTAVSATDTVTTTLPANPVIALDKQAAAATGSSAGATIAYTFVVRNAGNVTLTSVAIDDAKVGPLTCPTTTLAPGATITCATTYTLTQADVDAGHVANTALVAGTPPTGSPVTATDATDSPIANTPAIALDKQAAAPSGTTAGSTIAYTFLVTNTGNVTLTSVAVADSIVPAVACPATTLAPGASTTCTASHTLTQADVDAGSVVNTALVAGTPPTGAPVTATDTVTTLLPADPAVTFDKQAGAPSGTIAGGTIAYTFVVQNTGNVTVHGVAITDAKVGLVTCAVTTLSPGATTTCTKAYTLTQADVDAGHVSNSATVEATPPAGDPVTASDTTDTPVAAGPSITLDKAAGAPSGNTAGSTVAYTFVVTNTGNVSLTAVAVDDPRVGPVSCPSDVLVPGASTTCTKTYTLTQADVDAGSVVNTATVAGTPPTGAEVTATDTVTTTLPANPVIALDKQAAAATGSSAGATIAYSFVLTNTGNVTLHGIAITDAVVGAVTCPTTTLAPGATTTCTTTYALTQGDVDSGHVLNTATVAGTTPTGATVGATDSTDSPIASGPSITLDKTAGAPSGNVSGATIAYSFLVTNDGNLTLTGIGVTDPTVGAVSCPVTTLAPAASTTCTATYTLTQTDVDAGSVVNTATASGTTPTGGAVTATDKVTTPITAAPAISVDKQAGTPTGTSAGATIAYTFVVTNTGNVTLHSVGITDVKTGPVTCTVTTLAPGATATCVKNYPLTQADIDAGHVTNTATVAGSPAIGAPVTGTDTTDSPIANVPGITLAKTAGALVDLDANGPDAGDAVPYSFLVTNTGNVTLTSVSVADGKVGTVTCPVATLAPATATTCTATYTITQDDVDTDVVDNTATVSGTPPTGAPVTATDSVEITVGAPMGVALDKQATTPTGSAAGDRITYSFSVTNTGNVTLDPVSVSDPVLGPVTCPVAPLAPGATVDCTPITYTLTQADVDAGHKANTATAVGVGVGTLTAPAIDSTDTPIAAGPAITLDKIAGTPSGATAGSTIDYTFVVTNSGNVTLTEVDVADDKVGTVSCPVTTLAPGESTTCAATYAITQAEVDAGTVDNSATTEGTAPTGTVVTAGDTTSSGIPAHPALTLDKQAGTPTSSLAGGTIDYTFLVRNTGNVTLDTLFVDDPTVGPVDCPPVPLGVGDTVTCTATYALTQDDVDAGHIANTANALGAHATDWAVPAIDSTDTPLAAAPAIALEKTAGIPSGTTAGSTIGYTFEVTNTGNLTLTAVTVSDAPVGAVTCPAAILPPGDATTCAATYTLTQADVDAGSVVNAASVTGTSPSGAVVTATDTVTTTIPARPAITLDKQAGTPSGMTAGSTIAYSFVVTNTGNVTLSAVAVDDTRVGTVSCPVGTLAPGAVTTCTASYTLTQADVDAGNVDNSATVTGTPPTGSPVTAGDTTSTGIAASPSITLDKQAGTPSGSNAGSTIAYSFVVQNTGNVTLTAVAVDDARVGTVSCPVTTLAPDAVTTCSATYLLTQADVDAGHLANSATAGGTPPAGARVEAGDSTDTTIVAGASITLDKQAGTPTGTTAGSTVAYTFFVRNTGNVTLTGVGVSDVQVGTVSCPVTALAPGTGTTCTATYLLTQVDVDAGHVDNSATASGTTPGGATVNGGDTTTTGITASPSIRLDKQAGTPSGTTAGSTIPYSFVVTNTGNVTLTGVGVADARAGTVTCPVTTLAPGDDTTCTASYTLTQADVDAGTVDNTATASGNPPTGSPVTSGDTTSTTIARTPSITLDKQAGTPSGNTAGSTIDYTFAVTNTGNVTLAAVAVSDPSVGPVACTAATLAPGASTTCTAGYTLTQADVDAGHFANSATVTGTPPAGADVSATDSTDSTINAGPAIALDKVAGAPSGTVAGSTIAYTFIVTNSGNVSLASVAVSDPKAGTVTCPVDALAPGASITCTATYALTQADVDAGVVDNSATASGTPPTGDPVTAGDTTSTAIAPAPALTLHKQAGAPSGNTAGSTIPYSFGLTNEGNVTLSPVTVTDARVGTVTCPATSLAPGASTTCTATYTLTQADVDAGTVVNTATATGTPPAGGRVIATDTETTPIIANAGIDLVKTGTVDGDRAGGTISYTFAVTNTGNVTLAAVEVTDAKAGTVTCPDTMLAPGASTTCSATYLLTQADIDTGLVHNEATVAGTTPSGEPVTATDAVDLPIAPGPAITLDKQAGIPSGAQAGGTIAYTFAVTNTGNVTLAAVSVTDAKVGTVACPVATLAPGETTTCTARYTLTQADLDAGTVTNAASVTGTPPTGDAVSDEDAVTTPLGQLPALSLEKTADVMAEVVEGDLINFTFVVTNTGTVTLNNLALVDPMLASISCPTTTLAPGASMTCTGSPYSVTKADVTLGHVTNVADVSSTYCPTTECVPVHAGDSVTVATAIVEGETDGGGGDGHGGHGGNGGLAYTGVSGAPELVALGGAILAAGVLLLVAARRRRKA